MQRGPFINTNLALSQIGGRTQDAEAGDHVEVPVVREHQCGADDPSAPRSFANGFRSADFPTMYIANPPACAGRRVVGATFCAPPPGARPLPVRPVLN